MLTTSQEYILRILRDKGPQPVKASWSVHTIASLLRRHCVKWNAPGRIEITEWGTQVLAWDTKKKYMAWKKILRGTCNRRRDAKTRGYLA